MSKQCIVSAFITCIYYCVMLSKRMTWKRILLTYVSESKCRWEIINYTRFTQTASRVAFTLMDTVLARVLRQWSNLSLQTWTTYMCVAGNASEYYCGFFYIFLKCCVYCGYCLKEEEGNISSAAAYWNIGWRVRDLTFLPTPCTISVWWVETKNCN